jgi:hypothetical protein
MGAKSSAKSQMRRPSRSSDWEASLGCLRPRLGGADGACPPGRPPAHPMATPSHLPPILANDLTDLPNDLNNLLPSTPSHLPPILANDLNDLLPSTPSRLRLNGPLFQRPSISTCTASTCTRKYSQPTRRCARVARSRHRCRRWRARAVVGSPCLPRRPYAAVSSVPGPSQSWPWDHAAPPHLASTLRLRSPPPLACGSSPSTQQCACSSPTAGSRVPPRSRQDARRLRARSFHSASPTAASRAPPTSRRKRRPVPSVRTTSRTMISWPWHPSSAWEIARDRQLDVAARPKAIASEA